MLRQSLLAGFGLLSLATAQTPIAMPPYVSTYTAAATRGFYFTCPTDCVITGLQAPNEAAQPNQVVEVLDFGVAPPPMFPAVVGAVNQLFYDNSVPAGTQVNTNIALQAGNVYGIFGCCTDAQGSATTYTSYGSGSFITSILGSPTTIARLLTQSGIASNGGNQPCSASTGPLGRVLVDIMPPAGLYAGFTADVTEGSSPLTVNFSDTSYTNDPGGVLSWAWDFENDGTIDSTAQNPTHTFTSCGDYDVSLTVTDASNPADTELLLNHVRTDLVAASFTVSLLTPPNVWQFTDTSTLPPTAWAWDFENDGTIDSTAQNPTFVTSGSCLNTTVRLDVTRGCRASSVIVPTFAAGSSFLGEVGGGNTISSPTSAGNYFDMQVTAAEGIRVCGLAVAPVGVAGALDVSVYLTEGSHVGKEGNPAAWRLLSTGSGTSSGGGYTPPVLSNVGLDTPFFLPVGDYGMAVFLSSPAGMGIAYTDGPAGPYVGADITIHPANVGSSSVSELGPVAFDQRFWNGGFFYSRCSVVGEAGSGFYGTGCAGPLGTPGLDPVGTTPALGTTYQLDVTNVPGGVALMLIGFSHTLSPVFGSLPYEATPNGAPGCFLRASADVTTLLVAAGSTATWTLTIPNDPAMTCLPIFNQAAVLSQGTNSLGFIISDARAAIVGQ